MPLKPNDQVKSATGKVYTVKSLDAANDSIRLASGDTFRVKLSRFFDLYTNADGSKIEQDVEALAPTRPPKVLPAARPVMAFGELITDLPAVEDVFLSQSDTDRLEQVFRQVRDAELLAATWRLPELKHRRVCNFHGSPGNGKTMAAFALARYCGVPAYRVYVPALMSKYIGDSGKNIATIFNEAKRHDAVLVLDEADVLLFSRISGTDSAAVATNQLAASMFHALDTFSVRTVFTTNRFADYDPAVVRRIAHHVKFNDPDLSARRRLLDQIVGAHGLDINVLAVTSVGLSCAEIRQAVANACASVSVGDPSTWVLTGEAVSAQFSRTLVAKRQ